jgi:hypothetical protein
MPPATCCAKRRGNTTLTLPIGVTNETAIVPFQSSKTMHSVDNDVGIVGSKRQRRLQGADVLALTLVQLAAKSDLIRHW